MANYTNTEAWDKATQSDFATYNENGILEVIFTSNNFEIAEKADKFGRIPYEFDVIQNNKAVILSIAQIRLMAALKALLPLENKHIRITRTGEGAETQFTVEELTK